MVEISILVGMIEICLAGNLCWDDLECDLEFHRVGGWVGGGVIPSTLGQGGIFVFLPLPCFSFLFAFLFEALLR